ncbi:FAD-binding oxidoreductase [Novosphingobium flavum]|uniref:FAD-binding oxidoreductase n=1 Tax=Novosphingobium flavum TaxID=1778672 RepID=A0A7X1FUH0_9SPHN|nr:FAD-binding oxidoreductase [Novosphingobium flavum]MBC2667219.1 FAD-binding oxidoreductase [Novosphingobium flavum]
MQLSGWGRYPRAECRLLRPRALDDVSALVGQTPLIARGNGRAYGDAALGAPETLAMGQFNRMLAFDEASGILTAQAGVQLAEVIDVFLPRGWFPAVTPGTKFVTIGGAIAADVHGKNHHKDGSFSTCVEWIDLAGPDGTVRRASKAENPELFAWTCGGMGLTGVILRAAIRLRRVESGWIRQRSHPAPGLRSAMALFEENHAATYSVAWIDCLAGGQSLGRSLVMTGEHAEAGELTPRESADRFVRQGKRAKAVPFDFPQIALNPLSVRAFNELYYGVGAWNRGEGLIDYDSYFYPLDALLEWNRIYGRRGFAQFQCVIPLAAAEAGVAALLRRIASSGQGSFLAVLKRMGPQESRFSFPMEGYTLALDFPVKDASAALFTELERIVIDHGGRFYLAKDAFLSPEALRAADRRTGQFTAMRAASGSAGRFVSALSERLEL